MAQITITGVAFFNTLNGAQIFNVELTPSFDSDSAPTELHDALDSAWRAFVAHVPSAPVSTAHDMLAPTRAAVAFDAASAAAARAHIAEAEVKR